MAAVGALRVDLSANSAKLGADMAAARGHLRQFAGEAKNTGETIDKSLTAGLSRGVKQFSYLGDQAGLVHSSFGKLATMTSGLLMTGFNPLSLAIAGTSLAIGTLSDRAEDAKTKIHDLDTELAALKKTNADLAFKREAESLGVSKDSLETQRRIEEAQDNIRGNKIAIAIATAKVMEYERDNLSIATANVRVAFDWRHQLDIIKQSWEQITREQKIADELQRKLVLSTAAANDRLQMEPGAVERVRQRWSMTLPHDRLVMPEGGGMPTDRGPLHGDLATNQEIEALRASAAQARADQKRDYEAIRKSSDEFWKAWDERTVNVRRANKLAEDAFDELGHSVQEVEPPVYGLREELSRMSEELRHTDRMGVELAHTLTDGLGSRGADAFLALADGSKSAKEAFGDFAKSMVSDIMRIVIATTIANAALSALGFGGPAGISAAGNASQIRVTGYSSSGVPNLGLKSTPAPAAYGANGPTKIEYHDHTKRGTAVETQEDITPEGLRRLKVMVTDIVADDAAQNGRASRALAATYGLSRTSRRRS